MSMELWNPFRDMVTLRDAMDRMFPEGFSRPGSAFGGRGMVPLDIADNGNAFEITATMPGVKPDDVQITVQGDTLSIRGETNTEHERKGQQNENWIAHERQSGAFYRSVSLPAPVDADKAQAHFEHGILHLTLPKSESAKPKQIRISGQALEQHTEQRQGQQGQQGETH